LGHANGTDVTEFHQRLFDLAGGKTEWWSYLVAWLGQMLIEPAHMPPVIVLLFSYEKGIGKNMFFESLMKRVLGSEKHAAVLEFEGVFPEFFSPRAQKLMCLADETDPGQSK
jgi:hypothetical protein